MNPSFVRIFIKTLRVGKELKLPSIYSNTYFNGDIETSALQAFTIYNKEPKNLSKKNSFTKIPSIYSNRYNYREAEDFFLKDNNRN